MGAACTSPARVPKEAATPALATTVQTVLGTAVDSHEEKLVLQICDVLVLKRPIPGARPVYVLAHGKARVTLEAVAPVVEALLSELRASCFTTAHETFFATNDTGFSVAHFSLWQTPHPTDETARRVLRDALLSHMSEHPILQAM